MDFLKQGKTHQEALASFEKKQEVPVVTSDCRIPVTAEYLKAFESSGKLLEELLFTDKAKVAFYFASVKQFRGPSALLQWASKVLGSNGDEARMFLILLREGMPFEEAKAAALAPLEAETVKMLLRSEASRLGATLEEMLSEEHAATFVQKSKFFRQVLQKISQA